MPELPESTSPRVPGRRERHLPATGLPAAREDRRVSSAVAIALHILVILLIIGPSVSHTGIVIERPQGAGGLGPSGGGGGGKGGTGGTRERVTYVRPAPPPAPVVAAVIPPPTPVPQPKPPEVKPPEVKVEPTPPEVKPEVKPDATSNEVTAPTPGTGGGTGRDGTNGTGPGTGGGTGSGVGTGRGAGTGPGTGGGVQENYPPQPFELFIPPLPFPSKVRGFHLIAEFDVDETGKVLHFQFTSTGDRGYDKRIDDVLKSTRFRPGTTPDGKPIRMKTQIIYDF